MDITSPFVIHVLKHTKDYKSSMGNRHGGKLTNMAEICDRVFERLNLLLSQDPEGKNGRYIARRLAKYIGVSESSISQWKHGSTTYPRPVNLCLAAQYLKTTEWWLTFGNDRRRKDPRCDSKGNILDLAKAGQTGGFPSPYPYPPEALDLLDAAEPLGTDDRRRLKAVAYALAHSAGPGMG